MLSLVAKDVPYLMVLNATTGYIKSEIPSDRPFFNFNNGHYLALRDSDIAIAIACFSSVTFLPEPAFSFPALYSRMTLLAFLCILSIMALWLLEFLLPHQDGQMTRAGLTAYAERETHQTRILRQSFWLPLPPR
jgi:hypothetical protein